VTVTEAGRTALGLLPRRARRRVGLAGVLQVCLSGLDIVGVALFGLVGAIAAASVGTAPLPAFVADALARLGLADASDGRAIAVVGSIAALLLVTKSICSVVISWRVLRFLAGQGATVSTELAGRLMRRSILEVQKWPSQRTAFALGPGVTQAVVGIIGQVIVLVSEVVLLSLMGAMLIVVDPVVSLAAIVYFGLLGYVLQRVLSPRAAAAGKASSEADIASTTTVQDAVSSYRELLVTNRRRYFTQRYRELRWASGQAYSRQQLIGLLPKTVLEIGLVLGAVVLASTLFLTADPVEAAGMLSIFLAASLRVVPSSLRLQNAAVSIRAFAGAASSTFQLVAEMKTAVVRPEDRDLDAVANGHVQSGLDRQGSTEFVPTVVLEDVSFTYTGMAEPAVAGIRLQLGAGESLALVGSTGAGKSTLADLVLGVLVPDSGAISLGRVPPRAAAKYWPGCLGYVPQSVALRNASVRENVALALPRDEIHDDEVWDALERAQLAGFLTEFRSGLDTPIGENGVRLSGGQRQRLGLARALYSRPKLLVLDEATSALDAETERAIAQAMQAMSGEVTTVTIAHRLATIRHADQVVYLERGIAVAIGKFEEVRERVPQFRRQAELLGL